MKGVVRDQVVSICRTHGIPYVIFGFPDYREAFVIKPSQFVHKIGRIAYVVQHGKAAIDKLNDIPQQMEKEEEEEEEEEGYENKFKSLVVERCEELLKDHVEGCNKECLKKWQEQEAEIIIYDRNTFVRKVRDIREMTQDFCMNFDEIFNQFDLRIYDDAYASGVAEIKRIVGEEQDDEDVFLFAMQYYNADSDDYSLWCASNGGEEVPEIEFGMQLYMT